MSYEVMPKARCVRAVAVFVLLGTIVAPLAAQADPPTPLNVLFVANGWCSQEDDIENHFLDLGYNVTLIKDYKVKGTTSFAAPRPSSPTVPGSSPPPSRSPPRRGGRRPR